MRHLILLSDEEIENTFDDKFGQCVDIDDIAFTTDTLQDFIEARKNYSEVGKIKIKKDNMLQINSMQTHKGDTRRNIYAYDFGNVRAVCAF